MSLVWSWDKTAVKYKALTHVQSLRTKIIHDLCDMMKVCNPSSISHIYLQGPSYVLDSYSGQCNQTQRTTRLYYVLSWWRQWDWGIPFFFMTHNGHLAGLRRWISKSWGRRNHSCPRYVCNIGMPRCAGIWPKSDAIDCCYQIWLEKGLIKSQNKIPKPKLTFMIVGKRFVSCVAFWSHQIDGNVPVIIFGFSHWIECLSASFRFNFLVRLTDYFFRGADSTRNCPPGRSKSYYSWLLSTITWRPQRKWVVQCIWVYSCAHQHYFAASWPAHYTVLWDDSFSAIPHVLVSHLFLGLEIL